MKSSGPLENPSLLINAVFAENLIMLVHIRGLLIKVHVRTIVKPVVLGKPHHPVVGRLQALAI
jgi:hypothetical protein